MPEKDFIEWLEVGFINVWRYSHRGRVTKFRVVFLAEINGRLECITRYDTAHGHAHRDVLGLNEGLRGKLPMPTVTFNEAFDYARRDLRKNARIYLEDFLAH